MAADESDIDVSIASLWQAWQAFVRGKRASPAIVAFRANLEYNLLQLANDIQTRRYQHGGYESFVVHDPKRREIAVADVHDRVVHRLLYDYLVPVWDKSFCYDAWSCRKGKGLHGAIQRAQDHMQHYQSGWLWRSDITKFFDNVDHQKLQYILRMKTHGESALSLLNKVICSYSSSQSVRPHGVPIGNLTSQIFANIYLNEFDQFVLHDLKPLGYVRYGDDFVLWLPDEFSALNAQAIGTQFLTDELKLSVNYKHDHVQPAHKGLAYLGVELWPHGKRLNKRVYQRTTDKLTAHNAASYYTITKQHLPERYRKRFFWNYIDIIDQL